MHRTARFLSILGALVVFSALSGWLALRIGLPSIAGPEPQRALEGAVGGASIGGPFTLASADNQSVSDATYRGKWMLVYFGYTSCPDVCPATLNNMAQALALLNSDDVRRVAPLFITVDPKRDTPKVVDAYAKSFDTRIIGLSGSPDQIAAVAKQYHVYYATPSGAVSDYLVDHNSFIYLMTPQGRFADTIPGSMSGSAIAEDIRHHIHPAS